MLQDFLADGVVYLELRTTPRSTTTMSAEVYITVLLSAMEEFESLHPQLHTRLILSIDRRHSIRTAESILDLAIRLQDTNKCGVVGIDLCGDPNARPGGEVAVFTPVFEQASRAGLGITVHFAEAEASGSHDELRTLLSWNPGRLGHVIWEDEEARKVIVERELCLELCLSCNVQAEMVHGGFEGHHFGHWKDVKGPKISLAVSLDGPSMSLRLLRMERSRVDGSRRKLTKALLDGRCRCVWEPPFERIPTSGPTFPSRPFSDMRFGSAGNRGHICWRARKTAIAGYNVESVMAINGKLRRLDGTECVKTEI